jgi:SMC interacting uncharacterized protein involved in chromosome segregation
MDWMDDPKTLFTFILGVLGSITTFVLGFRKADSGPKVIEAQAHEKLALAEISRAKAMATLAESYEILLNRLYAKVDALEQKIDIMENAVVELNRKNTQLEENLHEAGKLIDLLREENISLALSAEQLRRYIIESNQEYRSRGSLSEVDE